MLQPVTIGDLTLKNRVVMAPLIRSRSNTEGVPPDFAADCFGRPYLANPDLIGQFASGAPLAEAPKVYRYGSADGYSDWPSINGPVPLRR